MKSDVYFVPVVESDLEARCSAFEKLLGAIGPFLAFKKDELVPVKLTIGDAACTHHIHPGLVKRAVENVKKSGAKPFLFDTNVIYKGERQNAVDHMSLACAKGFSQASVGAPFIVGDGVLGRDGRVEVEFDPDGAIWLGGTADVLVEGSITLGL